MKIKESGGMDIQEIGFGDFCTIEQKRYVGPNEFYGYKVVGRKKSNVWTDVPVDANNGKETRHDYMDDVVTVVCNNLDDRTVYQFRVSDLASVKKAQAVPEGFVLVEREKLAMIFETATNALVYHAAPPKHDALSIIQGIARKAMIEAQEPAK